MRCKQSDCDVTVVGDVTMGGVYICSVVNAKPITRVVVIVHFEGGSSCRKPSYKVFEAWFVYSSWVEQPSEAAPDWIDVDAVWLATMSLLSPFIFFLIYGIETQRLQCSETVNPGMFPGLMEVVRVGIHADQFQDLHC